MSAQYIVIIISYDNVVVSHDVLVISEELSGPKTHENPIF